MVASPEIIYQFVPELNGSFFTKIVPSTTSQLIGEERNREMILGEMQYATSVSGEWTFLTYIPYGLPAVSGS